MTGIGLCSTSDVIVFDQNWYHLYLSSAEGKDLSNDQGDHFNGARDMQGNYSEIWVKNSKFPATTFSYPMIIIACLNGASSEIFELEASLVKVDHFCKKITKGENGKAKNIKRAEKFKYVGHFPVQKLEILISVHAWAKML